MRLDIFNMADYKRDLADNQKRLLELKEARDAEMHSLLMEEKQLDIQLKRKRVEAYLRDKAMDARLMIDKDLDI